MFVHLDITALVNIKLNISFFKTNNDVLHLVKIHLLFLFMLINYTLEKNVYEKVFGKKIVDAGTCFSFKTNINISSPSSFDLTR